jgi:hypothetical protein
VKPDKTRLRLYSRFTLSANEHRLTYRSGRLPCSKGLIFGGVLNLIAGLSADLTTGALMISIALSFDSGILFCAAAKNSVPARMYSESTNIVPACSIFLLSEPIDCAAAAVQDCEHALDILQPAEFTIDRMRQPLKTRCLRFIKGSQESRCWLLSTHPPIGGARHSAQAELRLKNWPVTTVKVARHI